MIKVGIIGIGRWGTNYLKTFEEINDANVIWICSTRKGTINTAIQKASPKSKIKATTNYADILNDKNVDAVVISTPGSTHYKIARDALKSGKHILVEKPVALSSKEVEDLIKLSKQKKKVFMAGHIHLYNPAILKLKNDIDSGIFGKILWMNSIGAGNGPIRTDINAMWDYFPHDVSIFLYLTGMMPKVVSVNGASYLRHGIEDAVSMNMKFLNNIFTASIASWIYPLKKREIAVVGEKLSAVFDDYSKEEKLKYFESNSFKTVSLDNTLPLKNELNHFIDCISSNKEPLTNGKEALMVTKVLETGQKSLSKKGLPVEVE